MRAVVDYLFPWAALYSHAGQRLLYMTFTVRLAVSKDLFRRSRSLRYALNSSRDKGLFPAIGSLRLKERGNLMICTCGIGKVHFTLSPSMNYLWAFSQSALLSCLKLSNIASDVRISIFRSVLSGCSGM